MLEIVLIVMPHEQLASEHESKQRQVDLATHSLEQPIQIVLSIELQHNASLNAIHHSSEHLSSVLISSKFSSELRHSFVKPHSVEYRSVNLTLLMMILMMT
jgi:hypothetical protein